MSSRQRRSGFADEDQKDSSKGTLAEPTSKSKNRFDRDREQREHRRSPTRSATARAAAIPEAIKTYIDPDLVKIVIDPDLVKTVMDPKDPLAVQNQLIKPTGNNSPKVLTSTTYEPTFLCDLALEVENGHKFNVHRSRLAGPSELLLRYVQNHPTETHLKLTVQSLELPQNAEHYGPLFTQPIITAMLRYIYDTGLPVPRDILGPMIRVAHYFQIPSLMDRCYTTFQNSITIGQPMSDCDVWRMAGSATSMHWLIEVLLPILPLLEHIGLLRPWVLNHQGRNTVLCMGILWWFKTSVASICLGQIHGVNTEVFTNDLATSVNTDVTTQPETKEVDTKEADGKKRRRDVTDWQQLQQDLDLAMLASYTKLWGNTTMVLTQAAQALLLAVVAQQANDTRPGLPVLPLIEEAKMAKRSHKAAKVVGNEAPNKKQKLVADATNVAPAAAALPSLLDVDLASSILAAQQSAAPVDAVAQADAKSKLVIVPGDLVQCRFRAVGHPWPVDAGTHFFHDDDLMPKEVIDRGQPKSMTFDEDHVLHHILENGPVAAGTGDDAATATTVAGSSGWYPAIVLAYRPKTMTCNVRYLCGLIGNRVPDYAVRKV